MACHFRIDSISSRLSCHILEDKLRTPTQLQTSTPIRHLQTQFFRLESSQNRKQVDCFPLKIELAACTDNFIII